MGSNKFGIGDRVTLVLEFQEEPRHLEVYSEREVIGVSRLGGVSRYTPHGIIGVVCESELYATDADLMDRVRCFAEAGRANGNTEALAASAIRRGRPGATQVGVGMMRALAAGAEEK